MDESVPLFRTPTLRSWLTSRFLSSLARQTQNLVVAWQIFEITESPLALGLVGLAEALPYLLVALWAGHAADRYEKKYLICISKLGLILCSIGLLICSSSFSDRFHVSSPTAAQPNLETGWQAFFGTGMGRVLPIYLILGFSAITASLELPASSSYVQMLIARPHFSRVAAWNFAQFQIATMAGPLLGGFLLERGGAELAYSTVIVLFVGSALFATRLQRMTVPPHPSASQEVGPENSPSAGYSSWESIQIGLQFLLKNKLIFACMSLDMWTVLFGDVIAILPVFAKSYGVGALGLGMLRSAPAIGGCITSLLEVRRPLIRATWNHLLCAVVVFGVSIVLFALSRNLYVALLFLTVSGLADGVSVIIRQSIYQANTPDHLRGRVASVSGMFIRISNELGGFESGLAAQWLGAIPSVLFGGTISLLVAAIMWLRYRDMNFDSLNPHD